MAQIPVACLGGILALIVTGTLFSVSAGVGFISIFGIAVMDGILLSFYIRNLWEQGHPFLEGIILGSDRRFRAVIMTADGGRDRAAAGRAIHQNRRPDPAPAPQSSSSAARWPSCCLPAVCNRCLSTLCHRGLRLQES